MGTGFGRAFAYLNESDLKIHLLFDEFEQTADNPELGDSFYDALRSLPTRAGNISYIIATRTGLAELQPTYYKVSSPFFNIFTTITLPPFSEDEAQDLIFDYFERVELDFSLATKLVNELPFLYDKTGYHPFFLQALCYHLCMRLDKSDWPFGQAQEEALRAFKKDSESHFKYYWQLSSPEEQEAIKKLAISQSINRDELKSEALIESLKDRCLVVQATGIKRGWRLFSSAFAIWVKEQSPIVSEKGFSEKISTITNNYLNALAGGEILQALRDQASQAGVNLSYIKWEGPENLVVYNVFQAANAQGKLEVLLSIIKTDGFDIPFSTSKQQISMDWGEAPDIQIFFGRTKELATLEYWIINERCRLVAILGVAGIGKTNFSLKLAQGIQDKFDYVIWRRLFNAPPLTETLSDFIKFLSNQQEVDLPDVEEDQISRLLHYLQMHRCLLILDNMEAILQEEPDIGEYQEGYEGYGELISWIGGTSHQSCLLLISREKPPEIARLDGKNKTVRSLNLRGLNELDAKKIFTEISSFSGSEDDWKELIASYDGNPLALEIAARHIDEVFSGSISQFLSEKRPVLGDLRDLIDWHFTGLSDEEKEIMYWLAIDREPVSILELKEDILSPITKKKTSITTKSRWILVN